MAWRRLGEGFPVGGGFPVRGRVPCIPDVLCFFQECMLDFVNCSFVSIQVMAMFFFSLFIW